MVSSHPTSQAQGTVTLIGWHLGNQLESLVSRRSATLTLISDVSVGTSQLSASTFLPGNGVLIVPA